MVKRTLAIGRWVVDFLFADEGYDIEGVLACLYDAYAPESIMEQAEDLMLACDWNCGFTYTNAHRRRAVVLIGPTSSGSEFIDTLVHEMYHLAVAIADNLGIDLLTETPAYLIGDSASEFADVVCQMGCRHCRCESGRN